MKVTMGIPEWTALGLISSLCLNWFGQKKSKNILEHSLKNLLNVNSVVLTDLGRQALYVALKSLYLKPNDEVIIPSYACQNVILPVISAGCKPVFADCTPDLNISINHARSLVNHNTKVVIVPHLYGKMAAIKEFSKLAEEKGLILIDDAAQVFGAKIEDQYVGTFGTFGIFSFGPFKSIMATRGGALIDCRKDSFSFTNYLKPNNNFGRNAEIAFKSLIKFSLRKYAFPLVNKKSTTKKNIELLNKQISFKETLPCEMSSLDAALINKLMPQIEFILEKRKNNAKTLRSLIRNNDQQFLLPEDNDDNIYVKFIILLNHKFQRERTGFLFYLLKNGIEAHGGYYPLHLHNIFKQYYTGISLPVTEELWSRVVCLPIHSSMKNSHIRYIAQIVNQYKWGLKKEKHYVKI